MLMQKYIPADLTTERLLYNYQKTNGINHDIFIKIDGEVIQARTIEQLRVDPKIKYDCDIGFGTHYYPFLDLVSCYKSCWKDFVNTSCYEKFYLSNGYIYREDVPRRTIELSDYIKKVKITIENNFLKIIKRHSNKNIILSYSKGIDSLLILSYIIKHKLTDKTKLIMIDNKFYQPGRKKLDEVNYDFTKEKKLGLNIEKFSIDFNSYLTFVNQSCPFEFFNYQQASIAKTFKNDIVLTGFDGNSVLFHSERWLWQIGKKPTKENLYEKDIEFVDCENRDFLFMTQILPESRGWDTSLYNNMESPMTDLSLMKDLPFVKIDDVDPNWFANAELSREIIHDNVGTLLDDIISNSGRTWVNHDPDLTIPLDKIDPEQVKLKISKRMKFSLYGNLLSLRKKDIEKDVVSVRVLGRIKILNHLVNKTFDSIL